MNRSQYQDFSRTFRGFKNDAVGACDAPPAPAAIARAAAQFCGVDLSLASQLFDRCLDPAISPNTRLIELNEKIDAVLSVPFYA